jgi:hypothetical protein
LHDEQACVELTADEFESIDIPEMQPSVMDDLYGQFAGEDDMTAAELFRQWLFAVLALALFTPLLYQLFATVTVETQFIEYDMFGAAGEDDMEDAAHFGRGGKLLGFVGITCTLYLSVAAHLMHDFGARVQFW